MDKLETPQPFLLKGNLSQGWELWLKQFYITATEKVGKKDKVKTSVLLINDICLRIDKACVIFLKLFINFPCWQITAR